MAETQGDATKILALIADRIQPTINNNFDALVMAMHGILRMRKFDFIGSEKQNKPFGEKMPSDWNANPGAYTLRYSHAAVPESTFIFKFIVLMDKILVHAVCVDANDKTGETVSTEITAASYIDASKSLEDLSSYFTDLPGLMAAFNKSISAKLVPNVADLRQQARENPPRAQANPLRNPGPYPQRQPRPNYPGGFGNPANPGLPGMPGFPGMGVGQGDLFPGGRPGNLVGPGQFNPNMGGPRGGFPGGVPGARFDPFGPPGTQPNPDADHFRRPGPGFDDDMFM